MSVAISPLSNASKSSAYADCGEEAVVPTNVMAHDILDEKSFKKFLRFRLLFEEVVIIIIVVVDADVECVSVKARPLFPERRMEAKTRRLLRRLIIALLMMIIIIINFDADALRCYEVGPDYLFRWRRKRIQCNLVSRVCVARR